MVEKKPDERVETRTFIKLSKDPAPASLEPGPGALFEAEQKEAKHIRTMRGIATIFTLVAYAVLSTFTMTVIFFQGFKFHGFELEPGFLNWLGGATIGEIGVLAGLVYNFLFKKK
jgi:hypothetical protein